MKNAESERYTMKPVDEGFLLGESDDWGLGAEVLSPASASVDASYAAAGGEEGVAAA